MRSLKGTIVGAGNARGRSNRRVDSLFVACAWRACERVGGCVYVMMGRVNACERERERERERDREIDI